jgi:hypothetical protein
VNLWAGQAHHLARAESAEEITSRLGLEARAAISRAAAQFGID